MIALTKMVQKWFEDQNKEFEVLFQASKFPYLNPFKHQLDANPWRSCKLVKPIIFQKKLMLFLIIMGRK